jgi:hypothetical protein
MTFYFIDGVSDEILIMIPSVDGFAVFFFLFISQGTRALLSTTDSSGKPRSKAAWLSQKCPNEFFLCMDVIHSQEVIRLFDNLLT